MECVPRWPREKKGEDRAHLRREPLVALAKPVGLGARPIAQVDAKNVSAKDSSILHL